MGAIKFLEGTIRVKECYRDWRYVEAQELLTFCLLVVFVSVYSHDEQLKEGLFASVLVGYL